ncbi:MAG: Na/Pi cotransporter family protein [Oscillospiraceae bacterium]|nr:Na/Pi cotransporter family protein [Oscillospiraceae bacterium]
MDIFDVLSLIGGLCLFLFGMNLMGEALERSAGSKLRTLLEKLTSHKFAGLLTGLAVTSVIQSSSATTVMVVGFVNSGLMSLKQAINVIMGANIGTTVTAWVLSLGGIDSDVLWLQLLKPTSFTPVLALIGIGLHMFAKSDKKKEIGTIFLGFATLMFGMDTMSGAVAGLADIPQFRELFIMFKNPILGVLAGAILTGIMQSSSASVGILQALADATGQVSYGAAIPIIMGQNIGTCVTAMLSSVGTNKNARRAAFVHLFFNIIGTCILLTVYTIVDLVFAPALFDEAVGFTGIAVCHSIFNVTCTCILLPMSGLLEKLVYKLVPDHEEKKEKTALLDERLMVTPPIALEQCAHRAAELAAFSAQALNGSLSLMKNYSAELAADIREKEEQSDKYEDVLNTYLVKLSSHQISAADNAEAAKLLKVIGDFERISDHAVNILESVEEMREKKITLTPAAEKELSVICGAVQEVTDYALQAFLHNDLDAAVQVEPLEEVIDTLREKLRSSHIRRLQQGECTIIAGFIWSDLLTNLERTADHCSNIAGCVIDMAAENLNLHESLREMRNTNEDFKEKFKTYREKYSIA